MRTESDSPDAPRWLHALAVLTVLCALPLVFLGASVTSHGVGMIDPRGFRPPWEIVNGLFENSGMAWRLEYGHRTFGFLVGMCGIALAVGCWFFDRRAWLGWVALLALTLICVQGALGILRVDRNADYPLVFKLLHGCLAQIVFAVLVSIALFTARGWASENMQTAGIGLKLWSIVTAEIVFMQLMLGALVRHTDGLLGPRGHLLGAFVVVGAVAWLLKLMLESEAREHLSIHGIVLIVLLTAQLWLGVESWLARFHVPTADLPQVLPLPIHAEWVRTLHYLIGTLLFATVVNVAILANRALASRVRKRPEPAFAENTKSTLNRELEGVA
ncbi:MAG: COX15/CtaA family protein [Planctomycetes bacterium]|nr:COX15/CtaA family protein [Planctomycetota bacterium]